MAARTRRDYSDDLVRVQEQISGLQRADDDLKLSFSSLETRVVSDLHELGEKFSRGNEQIHRRLDERSETPWAILIGFGALLLTGASTVGWLGRQPLVDGIIANREDMRIETTLRRHEDERIRDAGEAVLRDLSFLRGQVDALLRRQ